MLQTFNLKFYKEEFRAEQSVFSLVARPEFNSLHRDIAADQDRSQAGRYSDWISYRCGRMQTDLRDITTNITTSILVAAQWRWV